MVHCIYSLTIIVYIELPTMPPLLAVLIKLLTVTVTDFLNRYLSQIHFEIVFI